LESIKGINSGEFIKANHLQNLSCLLATSVSKQYRSHISLIKNCRTNQLATADTWFRTCRTSSFCTVAWQLARFQLTRRIARSLGDSWASCSRLVVTSFAVAVHCRITAQQQLVLEKFECIYKILCSLMNIRPKHLRSRVWRTFNHIKLHAHAAKPNISPPGRATSRLRPANQFCR